MFKYCCSHLEVIFPNWRGPNGIISIQTKPNIPHKSGNFRKQYSEFLGRSDQFIALFLPSHRFSVKLMSSHLELNRFFNSKLLNTVVWEKIPQFPILVARTQVMEGRGLFVFFFRNVRA
jgi:hypothetical protein